MFRILKVLKKHTAKSPQQSLNKLKPNQTEDTPKKPMNTWKPWQKSDFSDGVYMIFFCTFCACLSFILLKIRKSLSQCLSIGPTRFECFMHCLGEFLGWRAEGPTLVGFTFALLPHNLFLNSFWFSLHF